MSEPLIAQKKPYAIEVEEGRRYVWCACGHSKTQPFCDGAHSGTGFLPMVYEATTTGTVFFCGCKNSAKQPLCDGAHKDLP